MKLINSCLVCWFLSAATLRMVGSPGNGQISLPRLYSSRHSISPPSLFSKPTILVKESLFTYPTSRQHLWWIWWGSCSSYSSDDKCSPCPMICHQLPVNIILPKAINCWVHQAAWGATLESQLSTKDLMHSNILHPTCLLHLDTQPFLSIQLIDLLNSSQMPTRVFGRYSEVLPSGRNASYISQWVIQNLSG